MLAHVIAVAVASVSLMLGVAAAPPPAYTLPVGERFKGTLQDTTLGQAAGFYYARMSLADKMIETQPDVAADVKAGQLSFRAAYEPGFRAIMNELARRDPNFTKEWEATIKPSMAKQFQDKTFTKDEVQNALRNGTFNPRTQSSTERAVLCSFNPAYVDKPFHEFNEGFVTASYAGIQGDDAHRAQVTHPVSWGRADTGGKSLVLAGAVGAGPLVLKLDAYRADDTKGRPTGAAIVALLEKYGPKPAQGVTFGEVRLSDDQTTATRDVNTTSTTQNQTMRSIGRYSAVVQDDTLILTLVSCVVPVDPANPTADDAQIAALHEKYKPVLRKVMESLKFEPSPPAAQPPAPTPR